MLFGYTLSVNIPLEPLRNLLSTYIHRKARIILRKWRNWVITFLFVSFYVTAMSPKLQCHCNVGYKKNIHCHDHFHTIFSSLSHTGAANRLGLNYQTNYLHRLHPSKTKVFIYIVSPTTTHFTRQYHHSPSLTMHQWLQGLECFYLWLPRQEKVFFIFLRFWNINVFHPRLVPTR